MSMESEGREPETPATESEDSMFPSTPVWDRGARRRGFSGRKSEPVAQEPRSFAAADDDDEESMILDRPVGAAAALTETDDAGVVAPIGRADREPKSRGTGAAAAVAGVAAIALLAAGGWYLMRDRDNVAVLAPGAASTEVATAPAAPPQANLPPSPPGAPQPTATAQAEPPRATSARTEPRMAAAARARPASSSEAAAGGVDASAVLPDAPQPYSSLNPSAAPAPVNPAPSAAQAAPVEPIPSTPPTASETSPAPATPDQPPPVTAPPQP